MTKLTIPSRKHESAKQERTEIVDLTKKLLEGPLDTYEIIDSSPLDTYLTGILWPEGTDLDSAEDDQQQGSPMDQDGEADQGVPGYRVRCPCSIGLTFAVEKDATVIVSLDRTARYTPFKKESVDEPGNGQCWQRKPLNIEYEIPRDTKTSWTVKESEFLKASGEPASDLNFCLHFIRRIKTNQDVFTVTLINRSKITGTREESCLFQTGLEVNAETSDGRGAILKRFRANSTTTDEDIQSAALLYRNFVEYAVGHGVAVKWDQSTDLNVNSVATTWMPEVTVKGISASGHPKLAKFLKKYPDAMCASWLARADARYEITNVLRKFANVYRMWISESLEQRVVDIPNAFCAQAERNLERCKTTVMRMEAGIESLEHSDNIWQAFVLANSAMNRQACYDAKGKDKGPLTWRPFQLAYFLLVIPGLVFSDHEDRDCLDLLWFPTGGGKTEAYLAIAAFSIFFRRIDDANRRRSGGVDVLMRYTLRLLTVQQFQRAASMICACDALRRERDDLGESPISLGLYVGGDTTPNREEEAFVALEQEHTNVKTIRSTPRQLLDCPVCGLELPPSSYLKASDGSCIEIRCSNKQCESNGELIPVQTVDDFIYKNPPSLLIGTIDKFAQIPRRSDIGNIFGLNSKLRPGLIIQDELHLISGPLGSMAGLYEAVIDLLCTVDNIRPKIIGSTATIGQASRQVKALFDRSVLQFPPPGIEASDSFFAVSDENEPDRKYLGLCSAGRSPKFALQAAIAAVLQVVGQRKNAREVQTKSIDPFWTAVIYFNSLRELGGAHVLVEDDVRRHMSFLARRTSGEPRILEGKAIELSGRKSSRELPDFLKQLNVSLSSCEEDPFVGTPCDIVLASNMISVGVDVSRLGLMLVNGQPKSTAEYIQASSRIGRGIHGLVLTLYNFGRPRDVSHFEHFFGYHNTLYRDVEATSVTPWAPRARDKALHAIVTGAVRHLVSGMSDDDSAKKFDSSDKSVQNLLEYIRKRAFSASGGIESEGTTADLEQVVQKWSELSHASHADGSALLYWERKSPFSRPKPHLMTSAEEGKRMIGDAWPTPNSMREVEPSTAFVLHFSDKN